MRYISTMLFAGMIFSCGAQDHSLQKIWETDSIVAVPESVLADVNKNTLYVSLIDGAPWAEDGKGGVGKLSTAGKEYNGSWITGLNAPKGMGINGGKLIVADINSIVIVDLKKGIIDKRLFIDSAEGLNDITVSDKGIVFVSDSKKGKIWRVENDNVELYLSNINGINGLKWIENELFIGAGKSFIKANEQKQLTTIAETPEGIDGIEPVGNGDFILTAWSGYIFYVTAGGSVQTLLDTHLQKRNTADIGYDPVKRIVYVPTFNAKTVAAYKLN